MSREPSIPPRRTPAVGAVLDLADGDLRYRAGPLRVRVVRVRQDISRWYDGEFVWIEAQVLDGMDPTPPVEQLLIRCAAVPP